MFMFDYQALQFEVILNLTKNQVDIPICDYEATVIVIFGGIQNQFIHESTVYKCIVRINHIMSLSQHKV